MINETIISVISVNPAASRNIHQKIFVLESILVANDTHFTRCVYKREWIIEPALATRIIKVGAVVFPESIRDPLGLLPMPRT